MGYIDKQGRIHVKEVVEYFGEQHPITQLARKKIK